MKPIDPFYYTEDPAPQKDSSSLLIYYYPIIGPDAFVLYHYFLSFWDGGRRATQVAQILNHLQFGLNRYNQALDLLEVVHLIDVFEGDFYRIQVHSPLSGPQFLQDHLLFSLLKNKIGEVAIAELTPAKIEGEKRQLDKSQYFNGLFAQEAPPVQKENPNEFDQAHFQNRMVKNFLRYKDQDKDIVALEILARQYKLNWYKLYNLAEETAVDGEISVDRMRAKLQQPLIKASFSPEETFYIQESKSQSALDFLSQLKDTRGTQVTQKERDLLTSLQRQGLLDEVISIIFLLAYTRDSGLYLNDRYVLRVAEDFKKHEILSAEQATLHIQQQLKQKKSENQGRSKGQIYRSKGQVVSNVPEWSQQDYVDQTTPEERKKREEEQRRLFQRLKGNEDK